MNTIHAQLKVKRGKTVAVEIPTDEEIERIAMRMHKSDKPLPETILGWDVIYKSRKPISFSTVSVNPFTGKRGPQTASSKLAVPSEFTFGYDAPWKVVLSWKDGDDKPPKWFRYGEDKLILSPKQETGKLF
jgi:hypothetical protein